MNLKSSINKTRWYCRYNFSTGKLLLVGAVGAENHKSEMILTLSAELVEAFD